MFEFWMFGKPTFLLFMYPYATYEKLFNKNRVSNTIDLVNVHYNKTFVNEKKKSYLLRIFSSMKY